MERYCTSLKGALFLIAGVGITGITACQDKDQDTGSVTAGQDLDGDGQTTSQGDCNDDDPSINSSAAEICDGVDNNCDDIIDTDATDMSEWFLDSDGDGFGDNDSVVVTCEAPVGYVMDGTDCNDADAGSFPSADEICDGVDNNCDGIIDTDAIDAMNWFLDSDGDTFGIEEESQVSCIQPEGYVEISGDCDDQDLLIHPQADELCDGIDNNCDESIDNEAIDASEWYLDADDDGYGLLDSTEITCNQPEGYSHLEGDCDDQDPLSYPGAEELEDGVDNDCDGEIDNPTCASAPFPADANMVLSNPQTYTYCSPIPSTGVCESAGFSTALDAVFDTIGSAPPACYWDVYGDICGPIELPSECCYTVQSVGVSCVAVGRPFFVDGEKRVAPLSAMDSWVSQRSTSFEMDAELRKEVIAHWKKAAQEEHASIASFSRLTMQLMSIGAPPALISSSIRAQGDELSHAKACLHVVSLLSGTAYGFDSLEIAGHTTKEPTKRQVLMDSIIEGCVNETLAAAEAAYLAENAVHPKIRKVLAAIAKDEEQHAALGWGIVAWILKEDPSLVSTAQEVFAQVAQQWEARLVHLRGEERIAYGELSLEKARQLHKYIWSDVILPCAESLTDTSSRNIA